MPAENHSTVATQSIAARYSGDQSRLDGPLIGLANWLRLLFVPLAVVAPLISGLPGIAAVAVGAAVALSPLVAERVRAAQLSGIVHVAAVSLPLADVVGRVFRLYEASPLPYDVFAHALGVASATALLLLFAAAQLESFGWRRRPPVVALVGALVGLGVGLAWEGVEFVAGSLLPATLQHGLDDTLLDVAAGVVGATVAALLVAAYWRLERSSPR